MTATITSPKELRGPRLLPALVRDPVDACTRAALAHGGLARLRVGPVQVYVVSHPDFIRRVLVTNAGNYTKGRIMDGIRVALGSGLFTADGALWRRQRRLMQPAFAHTQRDHVASVTVEVWQRRMAGWETSRPIDLLAEFMGLNVEIILEVLFSTSIGPAKTRRLVDLSDAVFAGMAKQLPAFLLPAWVPVPGRTAYRQAVADLGEEIDTIINDRRAEGPRGDLLDSLLGARDPDSGETMSVEQVRDEICTLFMAGYESTATSLVWTCYLLLAQHPYALNTLRAEVDRVLGGRVPAVSDLDQLPYLGQVMAEGLRLYPAFPMYFRSAVEADQLGERPIPAGAQLIISPYATHRDPDYWPNPEEFDPDRFSPQADGGARRTAYYPFGVGQRRCIGEPMALTIALLSLSALVQRFDLRLATDRPPRGRYAMTYQPRGGLPVSVTPRTAWSPGGIGGE